MGYVYDIAKKTDDAELRQLVCKCPMNGSIQVAFLREPDFFKAEQVYGRFVETYTMRDTQNGILAGFGTRSIKPAYINGQLDCIGYLCNLRILPKYQKKMGLARGYSLFKKYHHHNPVRLYLTTIIEDNLPARNILESGRASLPKYHDIGRFCTVAINSKQKTPCSNTSISIKRSEQKDVEQIERFLNSEGPTKQFFPQYCLEDLMSEEGILSSLKLSDIYLAYTGNQLVGITAAWDQTDFRQSMVVGYRPLIRHFRPLINIGLEFLGYPTFPKPRTILNYFNLGLVCIKNNDETVFSELLSTIINERKDKFSLMIGGFHEKDPLLKILQGYKNISYSSRVYVVCWEDAENVLDQLDERIPYLELGTL